jgi:hypothetical protein
MGSPESSSKYVDGSLGAMDIKLLAISPTEVIELLESASKVYREDISEAELMLGILVV